MSSVQVRRADYAVLTLGASIGAVPYRNRRLSRFQSQRPNCPVIDVRARHAHLLMTHGLPIAEEIVVVRRQEMSAFANRVQKAAVVGWGEIDNLPITWH